MASLLHTIYAQLWPCTLQIGIGASYATFIVTYSGIILGFSVPAFGWAPLPLNKVGGSIWKPDNFYMIPSTLAIP